MGSYGKRAFLVALVTAAALVTAGTAASASGGGLSASGPLQFGGVAVGGSRTLLLTVTNTGTQTIVVGGLTGVFRGGADINSWWALFDSSCPPAPSGLVPGQSCAIQVTFQPLKSGQHKSHLVLQDSLGDIVSVPVSGSGL